MKGLGFWKHGGYGGMGFLYKYYTGTYRPARVCNPWEINCPERKEQVYFRECLECEKFQVWNDQDGELRRCYHEYLELKSRGHYDGTWDDHPENFDPETFESIQERKRLNEEINREMELERAELGKRVEELSEYSSPFDYYEYYETIEEEEPEKEEEDEWCR